MVPPAHFSSAQQFLDALCPWTRPLHASHPMRLSMCRTRKNQVVCDRARSSFSHIHPRSRLGLCVLSDLQLRCLVGFKTDCYRKISTHHMLLSHYAFVPAKGGHQHLLCPRNCSRLIMSVSTVLRAHDEFVPTYKTLRPSAVLQ